MLPALAVGPLQLGLLEAFLAGRSARTVEAYRRDLADFAAFAGVADGEAAGRALLALPQGAANGMALAYRAAMVERGLAPATINRRLAALRSLVQLGNTLGLVAWSLSVENVRAATYRDTRGPGRDAFKAMAAAVKARDDDKGLRDTAILRLLHDVALRRGEVVSLDLDHLDLERGVLLVLGKGRTQREPVTLPKATAAALAAWVARRGDWAGPLFSSLDPAAKGDGRLTGAAVYQIVRAAGADVGVQTRPHGLRHTAITEVLERSGGNVRAAQRFARHADVRVTQRYDDNRQDLAGSMAALIADDD